MTDLTAEPTVTQEVKPKVEVLRILAQATFDHGMMASYVSGQFGSAWYVEVPRHLNDIYEEVGHDAVRDIVDKLLDHDDPSAELIWDMIMRGEPWQPKEVLED